MADQLKPPANAAVRSVDASGYDDNNECDLRAIRHSFGFDEAGMHISEKPEASYLPSSVTQPASTTQSAGASTVLNNAGAYTTNAKEVSSTIGENFPYSRGAGEACTTVRSMKVPRAFMSGASPFHLRQRYLMWNHHGVIRSFVTEEDTTVQVQFHDATHHPEIILDNSSSNFSMADLNTCLVAFASRNNTNKQSELMVRHVTAWDYNSREWSTTMPEGERIECLAVGADFVAIATDVKLLRLFRSIATMCASDSRLVLARYTGAVVITAEGDYEHQLCADLYEVHVLSSSSYPLKLEASMPLPLGPDCHLEWMGLSTGMGWLVTMDSDCCVRLYSSPNGVWIPVLAGADLLKEPTGDFIWPVCMTDSAGSNSASPSLRYIYCRGARYPPASRSPIPVVSEWGLPAIGQDTEKGKLEELLMLQELMLSEYGAYSSAGINNEESIRLAQEHLANAIKLFAVACKAGRECRAAELAHLLSTPQGIQVMCNYAEKNQRPTLAEKVAEVGRTKIPLNSDGSTTGKRISAISQTRGQWSDAPSIAPDRRLTPRLNKQRNVLPEGNSTDTAEAVCIPKSPANEKENRDIANSSSALHNAHNPFKRSKPGESSEVANQNNGVEQDEDARGGNFFNSFSAKFPAKQ